MLSAFVIALIAAARIKRGDSWFAAGLKATAYYLLGYLALIFVIGLFLGG